MKATRWITLILLIGAILGWWQFKEKKNVISSLDKKIITTTETETKPSVNDEKILVPTEEIEIKPTTKPTSVPTKKIINPTPTLDNEPWGVAKQVDEVTWTMKVGEDETMATATEIWEALNEYRKRYGSQSLSWDNKLAEYAKNRAKCLNSIKNVDKHEGFNNFVEKEDGFNKLGFTALGENISYGYKLNGVHIIEWMYAGDKPHNDNQLDNRWNYVGIGVDGLATCLIFGTGKM